MESVPAISQQTSMENSLANSVANSMVSSPQVSMAGVGVGVGLGLGVGFRDDGFDISNVGKPAISNGQISMSIQSYGNNNDDSGTISSESIEGTETNL